jgi:hypothetical protein
MLPVAEPPERVTFNNNVLLFAFAVIVAVPLVLDATEPVCC